MTQTQNDLIRQAEAKRKADERKFGVSNGNGDGDGAPSLNGLLRTHGTNDDMNQNADHRRMCCCCTSSICICGGRSGSSNNRLRSQSGEMASELERVDTIILGESGALANGDWAQAASSRATSGESAPDHWNIFSRGFLAYMNPVVRKAWKNEGLNRTDTPGLRECHRSAKAAQRMRVAWVKECKRHPKRPRLLRALYNVPSLRQKLFAGITASATQGILATVARPLVLRLVVRRVESADTISLDETFTLIFAFAIVAFTEGWIGVMGRHTISEVMNTEFQVGASSLVYRKLLTVGGQEPNEANLISNDLVRCYDNLRVGSQFAMAMAGFFGGVGVLLSVVGLSGLVGVGLMLVILFFNVIIGRIAHGIEVKNLKAADKRLSILSAIIEGAQAVKFFAWEDKFEERIRQARNDECRYIRKYRTTHVTNIIAGRASPVLSSMATLLVFVLTGNELTTSTAFAVVSVFQALRLGLIMVPLSVTSLMAADVTLKRIERFLEKHDAPDGDWIDEDVTEKELESLHTSNTTVFATPVEHQVGDVLFNVEHANLAWEISEQDQDAANSPGYQKRSKGDNKLPPIDESGDLSPQERLSLEDEDKDKGPHNENEGEGEAETRTQTQTQTQTPVQAHSSNSVSIHLNGSNDQRKPPLDSDKAIDGRILGDAVLFDVNLEVKAGSVVAVCGPVGSGKSTLAASAIQAVRPANAEGMCRTARSVGIAPQQAFIVCGTVLENILLGRPLDERRLQRAIYASALSRDLEMLPQGKHTEVGERGTTLSGGQAQRVCVARAIYGDPDLLVLDDPLAAVDTKVMAHMFQHSVLGHVLDPSEIDVDVPTKPSASPLQTSSSSTKENGFSSEKSEKTVAAIHGGLDSIHDNRGKKRRGKSVMVVMNQIALLPQVDHIIFIDDGRIECQGSYNELMRSNRSFADFVHSAEGDDDSSSVTTDEDDQVSTSALGTTGPTEATAETASSGVAGSQVFDEASNVEATMRMSTSSVHEGVETNAKAVKSVGTGKEEEIEEPSDRILGEERREKGAVSSSVYITYMRAMGWKFTIFTLLTCFGSAICMAVVDFWLSGWADAMTAVAEGTRSSINQDYYAGIYAGLSFLFTFLTMSASYLLCFGGVRASVTLHAEMINKVLHAPLAWMEVQTLGRIMSRFSGDMARVDIFLALMVDNGAQVYAMLLVLVLVNLFVMPYLAIVAVLAIMCYGVVIVAVDRALRETKRISNNAMSPLLSNASEAVRGRYLIRAFGARTKRYFEARHRLACDEYARANFGSGTMINWGFLGSHILSFFVSVAAASMLIAMRSLYDNSLLGVALTYAFLIPYFAGMGTQIYVQVSIAFLSLERLLEYQKLPQEPPHHLDTDPPKEEWPTRGEVVFDNVKLRYRPGLPLALRGVSFKIDPGESIGVVGRTGAGKSSLISCLFRLVEVSDGAILIDGVNIATLGLHALRSRLCIIPQQPILMSGTVRLNLDPFEEYNDSELYDALRKAKLPDVNLRSSVSKGAENWSSGERQLLCFARALLSDAKVLIMDEPTASIDMSTDEKIQQVVSEEFLRRRKSTITIAHRINSIVACDRVLVMSEGVVSEYAEPYTLMRRENSEFAGMVSALGETSSRKLLSKAESSFRNKT